MAGDAPYDMVMLYTLTCLPLFHTLSKTFLFLVLLAHRARSKLLQLTRYINYLLTYLRIVAQRRITIKSFVYTDQAGR